MLNYGPLNTSPLNSGVGVGAVAFEVARPYRVEVRDPGGDLLWRLERFYGAQVWARVLEPAGLQMTVPWDADLVELLAAPNEIWVWRGDVQGAGGQPWRKLMIGVVTEGEATNAYLNVEADGYLGILKYTHVPSYTAPEGATVADVVEDLLALQTVDTPITLGIIDPEIAALPLPLVVEQRNLLEALRQAWESVGYYYWVDGGKRLYWRREQETDRGHWIKFGHNQIQLRKRTDYRDIVTRIYARGYGKTEDTRVAVTVNDAGAQATYGVRAAALYRQEERDAGRLEDVATRALAEASGPRVAYYSEVIDLGILSNRSGDPERSFNFEQHLLDEGRPVRLLGKQTGIDASVTVLGVQWDLQDLGRVSITVGDAQAARERDLVDYVAEGGGGQADPENRDTGGHETVRRKITEESADDEAAVELNDVVTWNPEGDPGVDVEGGDGAGSLPGLLDDVLGREYGGADTPAVVNTVLERVVETVVEAVTDAGHASHGEIVEAVAAAVDEAAQDDGSAAQADIRSGYSWALRDLVDETGDPNHARTVDAIQDAVAPVIEALKSDDDPLPVGLASGPGVGDELARKDHVHRGLDQPQSVSVLPALPAAGSTVIVRLTSGSPVQKWISGETEWSPLEYSTNDSGAVGGP